MKEEIIATQEYRQFITDLKARVIQARISASRAINRDLIFLYWDIGRGILEKQEKHGWGSSVVEKISGDLRKAFPFTNGFSVANLWRMRQFYIINSADPFLAQVARELKKEVSARNRDAFLAQVAREILGAVPWWHHVELLAKAKGHAARLYYLRAAARFGWSRNVLLNQIKAGAYERAVSQKKNHNFPAVLPEYLAEQADGALKSSYNLEFLGIKKQVHERILEDRLIDQVQRFILELGYGFCFIGRQHRLVLQDKEYFVDLLFYHRFLRCLIALELKVGPFEPEYAGKMDFYLNLLNEKDKGLADNPSIGIILCARKNDVEVEFSLKSKNNPIGVASYQLQKSLPDKFRGKLPSPAQLSAIVRASIPEP